MMRLLVGHLLTRVFLFVCLLTHFLQLVQSQGSVCQVLDGGKTDCSRKRLTYVPRNIPSTTILLRLEKNQLQRIQADDFPNVLPQLEELVLSENSIESIDTSTFCHKLPNLKILRLTRNRLTALPDLRDCKSLVEVHSANNHISTLSGQRLSGLARLEKVDLSRNNITTIMSSSFPKNTSIKQLLLTNNEINHMAPGTFDNLPSLEQLKLNRNRLSGIQERVFSALSSLQTLDLSRNRLTEIGHVYFTKLIKLKEMNLEKNRLNNLLDGSFYDCALLESLNLQSNVLTTVKAGPFFGLRMLQELLLAKNNITVIEEQTWAQASSISRLDLSQNRLRTIKAYHFSNARHITTLNLSNNNIMQIEEHAFSDLANLKALYLSGNQLSDSLQSPANTVFSSLSKLSSLHLNKNSLQTITSKLLKGLNSLKILDLTGNPVTSVESYAFSAFRNLTTLKITSRSLVCDCKISWFPSWLRQKNMASSVSGRCAHPPSLLGQDVMSINVSLFTCADGEMPVTPYITRELQPTNALRGSNVTLTCIATASSQSHLTVEWRKDGKIIPESSGSIHTDSSTADDRVALHTTYLSLSNISEAAEGQYQCGFKNDFGQDFSDNVPLEVLVLPTFTNTPENVTVKTGSSAQLLCEATGDPRPYLSWSKDGGQSFPAARDRRFGVNPDKMNEFVIKQVEWADRGVYYCNATNKAGSIISRATVNVLVPPMFTEDISCSNTKTGNYLLSCQAEGNPKAPIVWYKDGKVIQASEKYMYVTYNNLFIINATAEDSGTYKCSAKNLLGRVTQYCEIVVEDSTTQQVDAVKKSSKTLLDQKTITGLIVIAVVCCVVGTSLVWVVIIYQTRRRQRDGGSNDTGETTAPLNAKVNSTQKIGDSYSNSSSGSQTRTDSFFEYRGSRESPSAFAKVRDKFPTTDSELAAAMQPLNPNQQSEDSLVHDPHPHHYSHNTVGVRGYTRKSPSQCYISDTAHPFSTFQPRQHHTHHHPANKMRGKPSHSVSAEFIPYIDKRHLPPGSVLHPVRAPTKPPQAVVNPVHSNRGPVMSSNHHLAYEEPGYMNLPRSAVSSRTMPKNNQEYSDYMNVEPKDIHIYQNTSILSIHNRGEEGADTSGMANDSQGTCGDGDNSADQASSNSCLMRKHDTSSSHSALLGSAAHPSTSHNLNQSNNSPSPLASTSCAGKNHAISSDLSCSGLVNPVASTSIETSNSSSSKNDHSGVDSDLLPGRRREGLADSSFVERKYGLIFSDSAESAANA